MNYTCLFLQNDEHRFLSYAKYYLSTKQQQTMMPTWVGAGQKFDFFVQKSWFFVIVHISFKRSWRHAIRAVFVFFLFSISFKSWWFLSFLPSMISVL